MHSKKDAASSPPGTTRAASPELPVGGVAHLMPGQWHFGRHGILRTLLGSCVAITLWHPIKRCGGMCHFLLPSRQHRGTAPLDGRYGDEAVALMLDSLRRLGTQPGDYLAHLYGGADTMPDGSQVKLNVGQRNIEQGWALIDQLGFQLQDVDVGDNVPRTVSLNIDTGLVEVKRGQPTVPVAPRR